jgi:hypothetical protein
LHAIASGCAFQPAYRAAGSIACAFGPPARTLGAGERFHSEFSIVRASECSRAPSSSQPPRPPHSDPTRRRTLRDVKANSVEVAVEIRPPRAAKAAPDRSGETREDVSWAW